MRDPVRTPFGCRSLGAFNRMFVGLPEIRAYLALFVVGTIVFTVLAREVTDILVPIAAVMIGYPFFEYSVHRWLLHNRNLCRHPVTARVWWRIHYRHHVEPRDVSVILAAPWTLLVAVAAGTLLAASLLWSTAGLAAATLASISFAILYEYVHALQHSAVALSSPYLRRMRAHHLAHHYFRESGNFGIVTDVVDNLLQTKLSARPGRSVTARNLGYGGELQAKYPYVQEFDGKCGRTPSPATLVRAPGLTRWPPTGGGAEWR
jgi:sterol desaturase/sphingolipid hydroxylase (fatty acid hydroxylase superfamily)